MFKREQWRPIAGRHLYEVSDRGRVRNVNTGKILKPNKVRHGYLRYGLCSGKPYGEGREYRHVEIQVLVLEAFISTRPQGHVAAHNDGNPTNNNLKNLRWARNHQAKLTEEQARKIKHDPRSLRDIAIEYGVHIATVSDLRRGKTWGHLGK